jgi:5-formyltetrahydrofolate cyclo-ligase
MENIIFEKKEFRKKIKLQLSQLEKIFFVQKSEEICKNILSWEIYQKAKTILFYMPLKTEPNIFKVIEDSFYQKKECYIPKITDETTMKFFLLEKEKSILEQVESGFYGILEPKENLPQLKIETLPKKENILILIPAMAFDKNKNRIGKGKGFYDRFLSKIFENYQENITLAGISFDCFIYDKIPTEKNDMKVDFIISDCKIY